MNKTPQFKQQPKGFSTKAIHTAQNPKIWNSLCIATPLVTSTAYQFTEPDKHGEYYYARSNNPTRNILEQILASLDNAKYALTYASGVGAATAILTLFKPGDHIISTYDIFGGTSRLLKKHSSQYGIELDFIQPNSPDEIRKVIKRTTKMLLVETPTNPLVKILDLQAIANILKEKKDQKILLVVDNTFLTPYFQRPLELGVDIVFYSLTKYMNGHTDVTMGSIATDCPELYTSLKYAQAVNGIIPSPFDCYQVIRSLKTLSIRMEKHMENGLAVAKFLEKHPNVERVMHPGLPSHPQHEVALKQSYGHSGMIAFCVEGDLENTKRFMKALKLISVAGSLGGPESLINISVLVSHSTVPAEERKKLGITDNLVRFSVGLEDADSIIEDLDQALNLSQ